MRPAVVLTRTLDPVTDYSAAAGPAPRSQVLDRALKAVEGVAPSSQNHIEAFIVAVATDKTFAHNSPID